MRLTVPVPVSDRAVTATDIPSWVNDEARKVLFQLRQAANSEYRERQTATSAGAGAYVELWRSPVFPTNACQGYRARVTGVTTSGAAQRAFYNMTACYESTAGTVSAVGVTSTTAFETAAGCDARFAIDATNRQVYLEARDDATSPMTWVAVVDVNEAAA